MDAKQIWQAALERIRARVSPGVFATWFRDTVGLELAADDLAVGTSNTFAREHLSQRFHEISRVAASEAAGRSLQIAFIVRPLPADAFPATPPTTPSHRAPMPRAPLRERAAPDPRPRYSRRDRPPLRSLRAGEAITQPALLPFTPALRPGAGDGDDARPISPHPIAAPIALLSHASEAPAEAITGAEWHAPHPQYRFENFVVGTANRLAFAAAEEITRTPGERYNPLLLFGGVGLGKTHLLHAIGHRVRAAGLTTTYVTAERFTNEIIEAIRLRTTNEFRQRYRAVDVLLVDDVQFIAGKESTEEEFFHTFNALHERNKQIVLTSDRVPSAMSHLHDRLRSRFAWGLIADIAPPDYEHRLDILRAKARAQRLEVPESVLALLARPACESIRALEGALTRVLAYARMLEQPVDAALAARALAALGAERLPERPLRPDAVLATVARYYSMPIEDLRGKSRRPQVAWARHVAMYLLREETEHSLFQIGMALGGRDHTTILHGCAKVGQMLAADAGRRAEVEAIRADLRR